MARKSRDERSADDSATPSDETVRSLVTLFLVLHLFCLFVAFWSSVSPSPLQVRLLSVIRPYTRLLNFELPYSQYNLTHATDIDVDHRIEVLAAEKEETDLKGWIVLPDAGSRAGERYKRYQRFARQMARYNQLSSVFPDMAALASKLAQDTAANFVHQREIKPKEIRCRQHFLQPMDAITSGTKDERNPNSATFLRIPYAANVIVDDRGNVNVVKIDTAAEVAPPTTGNK